MRLRSWILPALLAAPCLLSLDGAMACIRFKKPHGAVPPGLREPSDPPPPPEPTPAPTPTPSPTPDTPSTPAPTGPTGPTTPSVPTPPTPPPTSLPTNPETGDKKKGPAVDNGTWEIWWELNRIEFFPHRFVEQVISKDGPQEKGPKALAPEVVKAKLWPALLKLKDDKQAFVREAALITMARVASSPELAAEARTHLLEAIHDGNKLVARSAALGLYYVADETSLLSMFQTASDPKSSPDVRAFLALSLTNLQSPMCMPLLSKLISTDKSSEFELVAAALMALGFVPGEDVAAFLKETFENHRYRAEFRAQAVESFGRRGSVADGTPILLKAIDDRSAEVRRSAAIALGVLDWRTDAEREILAVQAPYEKLMGVEISVEDQAKIAMLKSQIPAQRAKIHKTVRDVVKRLGEALEHDKDSFVNSMAAISLGRIASQTESTLAVTLLGDNLKKERNVLREYDILALCIARAPNAYDTCVERLATKNAAPTTRGACLIGLGILGQARGNEVIRNVLEDEPHPTIRGYAAIALGMLGDLKSHESIMTMLKTTKAPDAMAYGALGLALLGQRKGADVLASKLASTSDGFIQSHMVYSMGLMKDRKQLDSLVDVALNHKNYFVQAAAVAAIGYVSSAEEYPKRHRLARGFNYMLSLDIIETYFYKL